MINDDIRKEWDKIVDQNAGDDVEWIEYNVDSSNRSYPFWKSMISHSGDTYEDFLNWFKKQKTKNKEDLTGVVKPKKVEFDVDTTEKPVINMDFKTTIEENISKLSNLPKAVVMKDKTGVVDPKSDVKINKVEKIPESKLKKAEMKDLTGVVEPKSEVNVEKPDAPSKIPTAKKDLVDSVKPKDEIGKQNVPEIPSDKAPKGDKVGSVKPKDAMGTQNVEDLPKGKVATGKNVNVVEPEADFGGNAKPKIDFDMSEPLEPMVSYDWNSMLLGKFNKIKPIDD